MYHPPKSCTRSVVPTCTPLTCTTTSAASGHLETTNWSLLLVARLFSKIRKFYIPWPTSVPSFRKIEETFFTSSSFIIHHHDHSLRSWLCRLGVYRQVLHCARKTSVGGTLRALLSKKISSKKWHPSSSICDEYFVFWRKFPRKSPPSPREIVQNCPRSLYLSSP